MIITESNCPALKFIRWDSQLDRHPEFVLARKRRKDVPFLRAQSPSSGVDVPLWSQALNVFGGLWDHLGKDFRQDVWIASRPYLKGFDSAADGIARHRAGLYSSLIGEHLSGCMIEAADGECFATLYSVTLHRCEDESLPTGLNGIGVWWDGVIITLQGRQLVAWVICDSATKVPFASALPKLEEFYVKANGALDSGLLFTVVDQIVVRRYANVVRRSADEKPSVVEKSRGDSSDETPVVKAPFLDVVRYDINWYTETVRSAGFARKGYMAVRWKGPRSVRHPEIVPVRPTWVKGYTRRARKPDAGLELGELD